MNSLMKKLKIQYPIFLSPMAGVSTPELAAAVSNAGGLGSLGLAACDLNTAKEYIVQTQKLTDQPFQVNFFCHQPITATPQDIQNWIDYLSPHFRNLQMQPPASLSADFKSFLSDSSYLDLVLDTGCQIVSFHFGLPTQEQITTLKQHGVILMATATCLAEALSIQNAGLDIIIAQGIEAGGHRGLFQQDQESGLSTHALLLQLRAHIHLPIVCAGGIMHGQQGKLLLDDGASAVQLGTAFIQCVQSAASDQYRNALFQQPKTAITACISGRPARAIINDWHHLVDCKNRPSLPIYPYPYSIAKQLSAIVPTEHNDFSIFWAGANVHQIRALSPEALIQTLVKEMQ